MRRPAEFLVRHAAPEDIPTLYRIATSSPESWPRVCDGPLPPPNRFADTLWAGTEVVLVVVARAGAPIGVGSLFEADLRSETACCELVLARDAPHLAEVELLFRLLAHAFDRSNFRKIYFQYHEYG